MAWEPDRRSNFFFNPPAHLCAVTYMTEISLIVTLNKQSHLNSRRPILVAFYDTHGNTEDTYTHGGTPT